MKQKSSDKLKQQRESECVKSDLDNAFQPSLETIDALIVDDTLINIAVSQNVQYQWSEEYHLYQSRAFKVYTDYEIDHIEILCHIFQSKLSTLKLH